MTSSKRILVIQSDHPVQGWLRSVLGAEGFSVSLVDTVKQGQELLSARSDFAAIICDYGLPDGTYRDLLNELRSRPDAVVPMLLISGSWIQRIHSPGAVGFDVLSKPFDGVQLLAALNRLLHPTSAQKAIARDFAPLPSATSGN